ncbi:MAG: sn-glycerol-3-phosphate ABC transporter ATP-binding protein UgpC [Planctomycetota bacterium]
MAQVILKNVSKVYTEGNVQAVTDFDLEIRDREFVVLVGPSGCGKSTTLRMVAGLEEITRGEIQIGKRIVNDVPPKDRNIAMVFQNYALYPHMTVFDNMAFGLKLRKFPKADIYQRVQDAAEILGLQHLLDRKPKALSGGQRQRVAVGRAIVRKPDVFLFDEPLSNLDAKLRVQMRVEISRLHQRLNATMIYVTHDQIEAMTMGDRIVVMQDGFIQQVADPITLYDAPDNRFVAGFIGTPPMNFFEGILESENGSLIFKEPTFSLSVPREMRTALEPYAGQKVALGIRPEDIGSNAAEMLPDAPRVPAQVDVIEPMGSETYVYLNTGSTFFISRMGAYQSFSPGEAVSLPLFMKKAHFFETKTRDQKVIV